MSKDKIYESINKIDALDEQVEALLDLLQTAREDAAEFMRSV